MNVQRQVFIPLCVGCERIPSYRIVTSAIPDRDVFNEKPSKEELVSATEDSSSARVAASAIIHTTMGDIQVSSGRGYLVIIRICPT